MSSNSSNSSGPKVDDVQDAGPKSDAAAIGESEERLRLALDAGRIGTWEWNIATNKVFWSPGLEAIHGLPRGSFDGTFSAYQNDIHPDDRERVLKAIRATLVDGLEHLIEYRIVVPSGTVKWVEGRGRLFRDKAGRPGRMVGVCMDVTARKLAEEQSLSSEAQLASEANALKRLNDASSRLWRHHDLKAGLKEILATTIELLGADQGNIQLLDGRRVLRIEAQRGFDSAFLEFFREVSTADNSACARVLRSGERVIIEDVENDPAYEPYRQAAREAGYRSVQSTPLVSRDGTELGVLSIHFRSPHRPGEQALRRLDLFVRQAADFIERCKLEDALQSAAKQQKAVATLGEMALRAPPLQRLFDDATRLVAETLNLEYCKVLECLEGNDQLLLRSGVGWKKGLAGRATVSAGLQSEAWYTLLSDQPVVVEDLREETRFTGQTLLHEHGVVSGMSCIIRGDEVRPWGVLGTHTTRRVNFTGDDVNFLSAVANILGDAIRRERSVVALRESERQLRHLAETIPQLAWYAKPDGYITWYNSRWYEYTGTTPDQMEGWGWQRVHDPVVLPKVLERWKESLATGEPFDMVFPLRRGDGVFRPFLTRVMPLKDRAGRVVQWFGTNTDISEQQAMQEALRQSEQRFAHFMEQLPGLAWIKNGEGRYVYANGAAQKVFGSPEEQLYGRTDFEIFPEDTAARFAQNDQRALATPGGLQTIETLAQGDGILHYSLVSKFPLNGPDGQRLVGGIAIDVTERKQAEDALRASEERFRSMANTTPAIIWMADGKGGITFHNNRWLEYTGFEPHETTDDWVRSVVHPDDLERLNAERERAIKEGSDIEIEVRYRSKAGDYRWFLTRATPVRGDDGKAKEWYGSSTDIHEIKLAEERQKLMMDELNHRVKNTLAVVNSIASQTLRATHDPAAFAQAFSARIHALAVAHSLLTKAQWKGAAITDIVSAAVAPFASEGNNRVLVMEGPWLFINPNVAVTLSLVLHELATNASKHGALSSSAGTVAISWQQTGGSAPNLKLTWLERGGPVVEPPTRRGFGSRLIESSADQFGGEISLAYTPRGVECRLLMPMAINVVDT